MNEWCPKISDTCAFCAKTEIGYFCGLGLRIHKGNNVTIVNRISEMPKCPKLAKKKSGK
jgi:hypothetical protein